MIQFKTQNWQSNQIVYASQMQNFSKDIYFKIAMLTALTDSSYPCIVSGAGVSISAGNITISDGYFRCQDINNIDFPSLPSWLIGAPGFFNVPSNSDTPLVAVANYYLIARLVITPINTPIPNSSYTWGGEYLIIPDLTTDNYNSNTDVILGQVSADESYIDFSIRDYDYNILLSQISQSQAQSGAGANNIKTDDYQIEFIDNTIWVDGEDIVLQLPSIADLQYSKIFTIVTGSNYTSITTPDAQGVVQSDLTTFTQSPNSTINWQFDYVNNYWKIV